MSTISSDRASAGTRPVDPALGIEPPVALVLCGGNSRGALQVGFYWALWELGLRPDFVIGSSIGALNGAFIAAGMSPDALAELWLKFRRRDALSWNLPWLFGLRDQPGLFSLERLRQTLRQALPVQRFEKLEMPLTVVTTDLQLGAPVYWSGSGDLIEPVVASMSLPGLFPPVVIGAHQHVDGGVANKAPLDRAYELGARTVLMIECLCCDPVLKRYISLLEVVTRSFSIAMDSKYNVDLERLGSLVRIHVVRPRLAWDIGLLDFSYTAELIEAGYRQSIEYLVPLAQAQNALTCAPVVPGASGTDTLTGLVERSS